MAAENVGTDEHDVLDDRAALLASLAGVIDDIPTAVAVFDAEMRLRHCNGTWRRITEHEDGRMPDKVVAGMHLTECIPGVEQWLDELGRELTAGSTVIREALPITADGRTTYWDVTISPLVEDGVLTGFVQAVIDATPRAATHRELEERVESRTAQLDRQREVADGLHDILRILNSCCPTDQVLDYIIAQARRLLAGDAVGVYDLQRMEGRGILTATTHGIADDLLLDIVFPTEPGGFVVSTLMQGKPLVCPDASVLLGPTTDGMEPAHRERLRRIFTRYRALLAVPLMRGDEVWGALGIYFEKAREFPAGDVALASDLADHLALAVENAQLRENAEEAAAVAERGRLARDLHDAVTQTLFSASLIAEVLPRLWDRDRDEGLRRLEQLQHLTRGALAEMRTLLLELRPAALVEAELADVLRQLGEAKATTGLVVDVLVEGEPHTLPAETQVALYRTAQEALNNIAKHSGADRVEIALRFREGSVELSLDDNGTGFDPEAIAGDHHGLRIMRERAEAVGGTFSIESTPGLGTCVSVEVADKTTEGCGCPNPSE